MCLPIVNRQLPYRTAFALLTLSLCLSSWYPSTFAPPTICADEPESGDASKAADEPVGASDEGEQAMQLFRKPAGWSVKLFAAEPELANPVAMFVDNRGRVFVCESFRQDRGVTDNRAHDKEWLLADLAAQTVQDRIDYHRRLLGTEAAQYTAHDDRIRMLVDTDNDGVADHTSVFAEGFNGLEEGTGAGVLVRGDSAYFTCIPNLWMLTDENGDGIAEKRKTLQQGYGVRVAFRGHDSHGLIIGPDGRLYFSIGDRGYDIQAAEEHLKDVESGAVFRCELDGSNLEVFATGLRNPQELAFDDYGYLFTGDNNSDSGDKARWVNVMQGGDSGWRMMYQYLPDRGPFNREKIWYPFSSDTPAYIVPPIENIGDGPSGLTCYPGTGLSGDYANCFFMVDFRGGPSNSGIRLIRTRPKGAFWEVERSEQPIWNILATDADFGPDGALWVCDWVDGWIGEGKGRIYRFLDQDAQKQSVVKEVESFLTAGFTDLPSSQLGNLLRHIDRRIRLESQWELALRGELQPFADILADASAGTLPQLHAVWGIGHCTRLDAQHREAAAGLIGSAIGSRDLDVRAAALKVAGELELLSLKDAIVQRIGDDEPRVQYAACIAAGQLHLQDSLSAVLAMLQANADRDPGLRHAGIMALKGILNSDRQIAELAEHESSSVRLATVVALRKNADERIAHLLDDSDAGVQLEVVRAVHDVVALHALLPQLADVELGPDTSPAIVHRVLNANFRLGGQGRAERLAAYASGESHHRDMCVEALNMLASWANPGQLDRVMNRYLPLDDRSADAARHALVSQFDLLLTRADLIKVAAIDAAVEVKLSTIADALKQLATDPDNESEVRAQALSGIVKLDGSNVKDIVTSLTEDFDLSLRKRALELLAEMSPAEAIPALEKAIRSDFVSERQSAWDALAEIDLPESKAILRAGLQRYLSGQLPADVWLNVTEAVTQLGAEDQQQLEAFIAAAVQQDELAKYRDCLEGGDARTGRRLFFTKTELSCVRCHKAGDTGGEVGPELTGIAATKDARYLLESIVLPDAKIAEKFETIMLLTDNGELVSGILRSDTASRIELMDAEGRIIEVDADTVIDRKMGKSSMPADLVTKMNRRELRDIVAYLSTLTKPAEAAKAAN